MAVVQVSRYRPPLIALHWLTLLLLVAVYATMELRGFFPRGSAPRELMKTSHYFLGLSVFFLTWVRLGLRATGTTPPIVPAPPRWQMLLARLVALSLYALMLSMPVLGYLVLNAKGHAPAIGGWSLPVLFDLRPELGDLLEQWHEAIAFAGYWLAGLHAAAAVYHHHFRHDDTLLRMSLRG